MKENIENKQLNSFTIAIDIDDTLFSIPKSKIYKLANKLNSFKNLNNKVLKYKVIVKPANPKSILRKIYKFIPFTNPKKYIAFENAIESLRYFKSEGINIILLTDRSPLVKTPTLYLMDYHNVPYDRLVMGCTNKHLYCKSNNVDVLIDNNIKHTTEAAKLNIKSICFDPKNKLKVDDNSVKPEILNNWIDITKYVDNYAQKKTKNFVLDKSIKKDEENNKQNDNKSQQNEPSKNKLKINMISFLSPLKKPNNTLNNQNNSDNKKINSESKNENIDKRR